MYTCLTALHTKRAGEDEPPYPHLRTLLQFDCQGLLNVIEIAFEEPEFKTDTGQCQKQRLVDILLQIMVKQEGEGDFSATQVGHLFTFLARRVAAGDRSLQVSRDLFDKVLNVLTETDGATRSHREERQQALLEMLNQGKGVVEHFDRARLLARAREAGYSRILEKMHEDAGELDLILNCHLESDSDDNKMQAFTFARRVLATDEGRRYDEEARGKVEKSVVTHIVTLARLSAAKTAELICLSMRSYMQLVLTKLENSKDDKLLYSFLTSAYDIQNKGSPVKSSSSLSEHSSSDPLASEETFEIYIDLMCGQEPERAAPTLRSWRSHYNYKKMLEIAKRHGNIDAQAHLLERDGQVGEAFKLLKAKLVEKLDRVGEGESASADLAWSLAEAEVIGMVQLLQRARRTSSDEDRRQMWFGLLDLLLDKQESCLDGVTAGRLKESVRHVVNSTLGHVPLRLALERVLKHPAYQGDKVSFGEIKAFLVELLAMYHYEETLLRSTVRLVQADLHAQVHGRHREARRGMRVSEPIRFVDSHIFLLDGLMPTRSHQKMQRFIRIASSPDLEECAQSLFNFFRHPFHLASWFPILQEVPPCLRRYHLSWYPSFHSSFLWFLRKLEQFWIPYWYLLCSLLHVRV